MAPAPAATAIGIGLRKGAAWKRRADGADHNAGGLEKMATRMPRGTRHIITHVIAHWPLPEQQNGA